jgi:hypothetical protein
MRIERTWTVAEMSPSEYPLFVADAIKKPGQWVDIGAGRKVKFDKARGVVEMAVGLSSARDRIALAAVEKQLATGLFDVSDEDIAAQIIKQGWDRGSALQVVKKWRDGKDVGQEADKEIYRAAKAITGK